jgi:hypothetical protein
VVVSLNHPQCFRGWYNIGDRRMVCQRLTKLNKGVDDALFRCVGFFWLRLMILKQLPGLPGYFCCLDERHWSLLDVVYTLCPI